MSKIICDICGTSYADTAEQCPICGCVRTAQAATVPENGGVGGYTHVKGGRFSKTNVKKRTVARKTENEDKGKNKKGLIILLIALALVCVIGLVVVLFATGAFAWMADSLGALFTPGTSATEPDPTEPNQPLVIPCEGLSVPNNQYALQNIGDTLTISCSKIPENTTDALSFASEDESVATVDQNGVVTAVQNGSVNIVIRCGDVQTLCNIVVDDPDEVIVFELDVSSVTLTAIGETKLLYTGSIPVDEITWETENEYTATVNNGVVTAVASGPVKITATYRGVVATCDVLCDIDYSGNSGSGGITEDGGNSGSGGGITEDGGEIVPSAQLQIYTQYGLLSTADVSIKVGETVYLYLGDGSGKRVSTDWTCSTDEYVSISGNAVKGMKSSKSAPITVKTEYENRVYKCVIRVP